MKQEQLLKALQNHIPEEAQTAVMEAVTKFFDEAVAELENEYEQRLNESYKEYEQELAEGETIAETGYNQALNIIKDLRNRLEIQKSEFDQSLEEGYEEAYQMLQEERGKNDTLEVNLYEEYDNRFKNVKDFLVDKLDLFLQQQGDKFYEKAKNEVVNDPAVLEHKVAFEQILDVAAKCLSDEDYSFATNSKLTGAQKNLEEAKSQIKLLESKNMRLSMENNKLNEAVRDSQSLLTENVKKIDRRSRIEKSKKVEGRGMGEVDRQIVIGETTDSGESASKERYVEQTGKDIFHEWKHLSGLDKLEE